MSWTTPSIPSTGQLITAAFWAAQIPNNMTLLATSIETATGRISGEIKNFDEAVTTLSISGGVVAIDLSLSNCHKLSVTAAVTSITIANWVASKGQPVTIKLAQDGTGHAVAFPAGWKWAGGIVPTVSGANKTDIVVLYSDDGGTTIFPALFTANA